MIILVAVAYVLYLVAAWSVMGVFRRHGVSNATMAVVGASVGLANVNIGPVPTVIVLWRGCLGWVVVRDRGARPGLGDVEKRGGQQSNPSAPRPSQAKVIPAALPRPIE